MHSSIRAASFRVSNEIVEDTHFHHCLSPQPDPAGEARVSLDGGLLVTLIRFQPSLRFTGLRVTHWTASDPSLWRSELGSCVGPNPTPLISVEGQKRAL
ncbi:hypothetical protein LEMLEM_LOCUS1524, partial [Lemmus lemmus]